MDEFELQKIIEEVLQENEKEVSRAKREMERIINFVKGQCLKKDKRLHIQTLTSVILEKLNKEG